MKEDTKREAGVQTFSFLDKKGDLNRFWNTIFTSPSGGLVSSWEERIGRAGETEGRETFLRTPLSDL